MPPMPPLLYKVVDMVLNRNTNAADLGLPFDPNNCIIPYHSNFHDSILQFFCVFIRAVRPMLQRIE